MALRKSATLELDGNFVVMGHTTISALPPSDHPNVTDRLIVALPDCLLRQAIRQGLLAIFPQLA